MSVYSSFCVSTTSVTSTSLSSQAIQRNDFGRIVLEQVRDYAAGDRRDDLLTLRRERDNAVVDRVAAGLLVIGDDLLERFILLLDEALRPPHLRGRRGGICDKRVAPMSQPQPTQESCEAPIAGSGFPSPSSFLLWRPRGLPRARFFLLTGAAWTHPTMGSTSLSGLWLSRLYALPTSRLSGEAGSLGRRASRDPCRGRRSGRCG